MRKKSGVEVAVGDKGASESVWGGRRKPGRLQARAKLPSSRPISLNLRGNTHALMACTITESIVPVKKRGTIGWSLKDSSAPNL
jgi:hypothetical protein